MIINFFMLNIFNCHSKKDKYIFDNCQDLSITNWTDEQGKNLSKFI